MRNQRNALTCDCPILNGTPKIMEGIICHSCLWDYCFYEGDVAKYITLHGFPVSGNKWWKQNGEFIAHGVKDFPPEPSKPKTNPRNMSQSIAPSPTIKI